MSHHAHGTRRSHGHATRIGDMAQRNPVHFSLYRELHPEMFRNETRSALTLADRIAAYLCQHEGTIDEIAAALQCDKSSVVRLFKQNRVAGAVVVGEKQGSRQKVDVWGLTE